MVAAVMTLSNAYPGDIHSVSPIPPDNTEPPSLISVNLTVDSPLLNKITVGQSLQDQIPPSPTPVETSKTVQNEPESKIITEQYDSSSIKQIAEQLCDQVFGSGYFPYLDRIITMESGWNIHAEEPRTHAYGLGQALPSSKMAEYGADYMDNPTTHLKCMLDYIKWRYGNPEQALQFHLVNHWYWHMTGIKIPLTHA